MNFVKPDLSALRSTLFAAENRAASPMACVRSFTAEMNGIFRNLYTAITDEYGSGNQLCLVAVGGYGRGELCPYSDIDLMLLYAEGTPAPVINSFERTAWDTGLHLGFSARTLADCTQILGEDIATDTALLESAFIAGNSDLYARYSTHVLHPFFHRQRRKFLDEMRSALSSGISSTADTLYRIEPDIKNGICCLRDCQRMAWAEQVAQEAFGNQARLEYQFLSPDDMARLRECYTFLLRLRIEMHMVGKRRLDILEIGLQHAISRSFGFPDSAPMSLMSDFFKTVTFIRQCILSFSEKKYFRPNPLVSIRSRVASFTTGYNLIVIDGILHLRSGFIVENPPAEWIMGVFTTAVMYHAEISIGLRIVVREAGEKLAYENFRNHSCSTAFCFILGARQPSGRVIGIMHETGILSRVLPEFEPLTCRVEFDTYHEYTTDQHTLMALAAFDELEGDDDPVLRDIYTRIVNRRVMRLALLLHDVGKPLDGDHCLDGAAIALAVASRIGFDEKEQEQIEFLVYHHLDLSELSLRRSMEENLVRQFAETVTSIEFLEMLYLITILDIRHVGSRTWTGWKADQLAGLFLTVKKMLLDSTTSPPAEVPFQPEHPAVPMSGRQPLPPKPHEQLDRHGLRMLVEECRGFYRITIVTSDRLALLADIAACFIAAGLQIMSAELHSFDDGNVIDVFDVEPETTMRLTFKERQNRFMTIWERLRNKQTASETVVTTQVRNYPRGALRQISSQPVVTLINNESSRYTIIEVRASNRSGLLHTIASALGLHNVNIVAARISTAVDAAIDVFYVSNPDGTKITDETTLAQIKSAVVDKLDSGNDTISS